jgi:membrane protein
MPRSRWFPAWLSGRFHGARGIVRGYPNAIVAFGQLVVRRFFAQGMPVFAGALAYRGLLALIPFALLFLSLIGLLGIGSSLPGLMGILLRLSGRPGADGATTEVPLEGLISLGAVVGVWSMATGAELFMRAVNAAHEVEETRTTLVRIVTSVVFLPVLGAVTVAATLLLLVTSRILATMAGWVRLTPLLVLLDGWLRTPIALLVIAGAVAAAYRYGASVKPPWRAAVAASVVAVALWATASYAFSFALSTVLDYGSTYGALGAAVALLVYLHLCATVLLLGAQVSALLQPKAEGGSP